jgi:transposase
MMAISPAGATARCGASVWAAYVILTRSSAESGLRRWGLKLEERVGFKRAAVAVARKLSVIMHAMLKTGAFFDRSVGAAA